MRTSCSQLALTSRGVWVRDVVCELCWAIRFDLRVGAFSAGAADSQAAGHFEECLQGWCRQIEMVLNETELREDADTAGPDTELEFWRTRMSKFNSITEQMKAKPLRLALGVCGHTRSAAYKKWRALDVKVAHSLLKSSSWSIDTLIPLLYSAFLSFLENFWIQFSYRMHLVFLIAMVGCFRSRMLRMNPRTT